MIDVPESLLTPSTTERKVTIGSTTYTFHTYDWATQTMVDQYIKAVMDVVFSSEGYRPDMFGIACKYASLRVLTDLDTDGMSIDCVRALDGETDIFDFIDMSRVAEDLEASAYEMVEAYVRELENHSASNDAIAKFVALLDKVSLAIDSLTNLDVNEVSGLVDKFSKTLTSDEGKKVLEFTALQD